MRQNMIKMNSKNIYNIEIFNLYRNANQLQRE